VVRLIHQVSLVGLCDSPGVASGFASSVDAASAPGVLQ